MTLQEKFQTLSLGMTPATILLSICVVVMLWRRGTKIFHTRALDDVDWLILGICISFLGKIGDNSWWCIAWHHSAVHSEKTSWWFMNGVFSNVLFRQGCALLAACCHLKAVLATRTLLGLISIGFVIGIIYVVLLMNP